MLPADALYAHLTAAALHGLWLPAALPPAWSSAVHATWSSTAPATLIASTPTTQPRSAAHRNRRGVYVRRRTIPTQHHWQHAGVRLTSPAWTIAELAHDFALVDLVVALDSALHARLCSAAELASVTVTGQRGVRTLRRAVDLADGRSESAWETVLRLVHVLGGITDIEPQRELRTPDGELLARGDLWLRGTRRFAEYDGGVHREAAVHRRDLQRDRLLARLSWERYGYTAVEIHREPQQILADAEAALGLSHDPRRVEGWLAEYRLSSLSNPGAARLARRLVRSSDRIRRDAADPESAPAQASGALRAPSGAHPGSNHRRRPANAPQGERSRQAGRLSGRSAASRSGTW
ncbi:MAG: hypothetical protein M3419_00155 [Actinomycetota bacterium]|nr:hypothetical protein [Actinomycetota bacterium]